MANTNIYSGKVPPGSTQVQIFGTAYAANVQSAEISITGQDPITFTSTGTGNPETMLTGTASCANISGFNPGDDFSVTFTYGSSSAASAGVIKSSAFRLGVQISREISGSLLMTISSDDTGSDWDFNDAQIYLAFTP